MNKFKLKMRKIAISLKRNYYVIPLMFVFVCCLQFLCSLFIFSPAFSRLDVNFSSVNSANPIVLSMSEGMKSLFSVFWPYNCIFLFIITLFTILYCVAYLQYAMKKFGKKRPLHMLIIFFVLWGINILLLLFIYKSNAINLEDELISLSKDPSSQIIQNYVSYARQTKTLLLVHIILSIITGVVVATAPLVQNLLKKITFKPIEVKQNEEK